MKPDLLITHDGQFHADEVFTIALIQKVFGDIPVERRREVTPAELQNKSVWVLDQYGEFNATKGNFDHHQNKALDATNKLILGHLCLNGLVSDDIGELLRRPFQGISDYDTQGPIPFNGFQVSEFFKTLNNLDDGFNIALGIARTWLDGIYKLADNKQGALRIFNNGYSIEGIIRVCKEYPILWTKMGKEKILVAAEKGQWRLHSSDTDNYPIQSTGKEVFLHANRFIASYKTKADAIEAAKLTARIESATPLM